MKIPTLITFHIYCVFAVLTKKPAIVISCYRKQEKEIEACLLDCISEIKCFLLRARTTFILEPSLKLFL
jgi:hypothetical protein